MRSRFWLIILLLVWIGQEIIGAPHHVELPLVGAEGGEAGATRDQDQP